MINGPMTEQQWAALEKFYVEELNKLELPEQPTTNELKELEARIDYLFTHARIDYSICKRKKESTDRTFKSAHKVVMLDMAGKTVSDREALAVDYLQKNILDGMPADVYSCLDVDEHRLYFIEAVVDVLREKHARCITISGLLKIEAGL